MKKASLFLSRNDGSPWMAPQKDIAFSPDVETENQVINLYPDMRYQEFLGIGGAFTETSSSNFIQLSKKNQAEVIKALFDPKDGIGLSFCRTHIHSCDFTPDEYTYVEENDKDLSTFSIDHDRKSVIPFLKAALSTAGDRLYLFASPWSPPGWMKDNGEMPRGGRLLEEYYATWADYMVKYFEEYKKEGIPFFGVTIQNEAKAVQTWESCVYTAEEEGIFAANYLRPALDKAGFPDVRIMIWDHNKERIYDRARDTFAVPGAREAIWGIAYHWYSGDHYDAMRLVHDAFPEKPLLLTEFALGVSRKSKTKLPHSGWNEVSQYSAEMICDFNNHASSMTDWNIMSDLSGGPYHNRDSGAKTPIVVDPKNDSFTIEPLYYALGHFSRFIQRGAVRIGNSSYHPQLQATAFQNPNGELVLVVLNSAEEELDAYIRLEGDTSKYTFPAESLATFVIPAKA